ncbi:hypothetical protein C4J94_5428 [Pseudomonas sp. R5-89-07]|nr:hypothetical protein C4J94_5428 [Pseudomonas sp. R5-89-07]
MIDKVILPVMKPARPLKPPLRFRKLQPHGVTPMTRSEYL